MEKKQKETAGLESIAENRKHEIKMKTKFKGSSEARESQSTGKDEDWYQEIQSFIKTEILKDNDKPSTRINERNDTSYKNEIGSQLETKTEKISLNKNSKDKDSTEASVQSASTLNTNMQEYCTSFTDIFFQNKVRISSEHRMVEKPHIGELERFGDESE